jgi:hypothetical protein
MGLGTVVNLGLVDTTPPVIWFDYPEEVYISPTMDGINDALEIPVSITDNRFVKEFRFTIRDADGNIVRVIENKERRPENETLQSVVSRPPRSPLGRHQRFRNPRP